MNVNNLFFNILTYYILIYFSFIVFKIAFILMILLIKFSIDFSFYILNNKFIKSLTEKIFNKKT